MMKDKVKEMYDQIVMPEECELKIRRAMTQKEQGKKPARAGYALRPATVMAALLAVLLFASVAMNNEVQAAVSNMVRYVFGGAAHIVVDTESGDVLDVTAFDETGMENPVFVEAGDGKMYFSYDGQYIDITDKTSMETPYIHKYIDDENIEHTIIIGGVPNNFGVFEFYREVVEGQQDWQGWIGGYSENYLDRETEKAYPWVAAAWEELDLLWPMPGE